MLPKEGTGTGVASEEPKRVVEEVTEKDIKGEFLLYMCWQGFGRVVANLLITCRTESNK